MSLPSTIDTAYTKQYASGIYMLTQQKASKFRSRVRIGTGDGAKDCYFDRVGEAEVEDITTRHPTTPLNEIPHTRRKVSCTDAHTATLLDHADVLRIANNPQNDYQQAQAFAMGRKIDDRIITAALGTALAGETGSTSIAFKDESVSINGDGTVTTLGTLAAVATVADIGLNKILTMLRIFGDEDVDPDMPKYWACTPKDVEDLLNITEIGSADYNTVKALAAGRMEQFAGFNFFQTTRLTKDAATSTAYRNIVWAQDGLLYYEAEGITTRIDERSDKSYSTQIYTRNSCGAVRMDGSKVHECLNQVA